MSETVVCNLSHICKREKCHHKTPHTRNCANAMPCRDFQWVEGKDTIDPPISFCVAVSPDGQYYTSERKWCNCCGGRGYTDEVTAHKVPDLEDK
jgi:hypothetical protein